MLHLIYQVHIVFILLSGVDMEGYSNNPMNLATWPVSYGYQNGLATPTPGISQLALNANTNNPFNIPFNGYFPHNPPPNTRPGLLPLPPPPPRPPPPIKRSQGKKFT